MSSVSVSENGTQVVFNWTASSSLNGQPLLGYQLYILDKASNNYISSPALCNGSSLTIINNRRCSIEMVNIRSTFSYAVGEIIKAKVSAVNSIGPGIPSDENSDIVYASAEPSGVVQNLQTSLITSSSVFLSWDALTSLADTSYAAIIDYKVLWNSGGTGSTFTDKIS